MNEAETVPDFSPTHRVPCWISAFDVQAMIGDTLFSSPAHEDDVARKAIAWDLTRALEALTEEKGQPPRQRVDDARS